MREILSIRNKNACPLFWMTFIRYIPQKNYLVFRHSITFQPSLPNFIFPSKFFQSNPRGSLSVQFATPTTPPVRALKFSLPFCNILFQLVSFDFRSHPSVSSSFALVLGEDRFPFHFPMTRGYVVLLSPPQTIYSIEATSD